MEQIPPGTQEFPTAAWMQLSFNQTMDWTNRRLVQQNFVLPGVGVMEDFTTPVLPKEINMGVQSFWFLVISQFVSNWESIAAIIRQCISWIRDL